MKTKQLSLLSNREQKTFAKWSYGGLTKGKRKIKRPLVPNAVTHLIFKSSKAKGGLSFYNHKALVNQVLKERSRKFFIEILDFVNMGNHLHIKVRFKDTKRCRSFLKTFPALLARKILGQYFNGNGKSLSRGQKFGKFWDGLVFTRVLTSTFEELGLKGYFEANHRQRELGYAERERYLNQFNEFLNELRRRKPV